MRLRTRSTAAFVCLCLLGISALQASDPQGHLVLSVAPVASGVEGLPARLRLTIEPVSTLSGAELRIREPEGSAIVPVPPPGGDGADMPERDGDAVVLGDLVPGRVVVLDFEVSLARGSGGIAGFTITGTLPSGRTVHEAIGWTLGHPGPRPVRRFGATEYSAVGVPEENQ